MTCDQAIELLPWLLNGTLEAEERGEVRRHLATCDRCREALAQTRESWATFDQHIPSRDLVALAWGESPAGMDPRLAEAHLASCPQCAAEIELARMSRRLEEEDNVAPFPGVKSRTATQAAPRTWRAAAIAAGLAAVVASSGWFYTARQAGDLAQTAQVRPPAAVPTPVPVPQKPAAEDSGLREQVAQLEGELQRLMGLQRENEKKAADAQVQVAQLERERETLARPQAADIVMFDEVVRNGESGPGTTVRAGAYNSLLLPARGAAGQGSAEILDPSGKVVFQVAGLAQTDGFYALVLPPRALRPGRYSVRIKGQDEAKPFQVVP
ncbi:MAG TPA: zf-HC2 domain-containing protein [Thermoanaerobaculia bacterium]|jgi:anti-sigma factor RsiW|nr:zf-HC2 domain-containing protein [Thermoanaerobaculia bacterium]